MQVTETLAEGLKREYRIVVPAADIEGRIDDKLDELGRTVPVNGFRSGKVPRLVLRQRFGKSVREEVMRDVLSESSQQAMLDRGVKPALPPHIRDLKTGAGADCEYTMSVEAVPEFEPNDVKGMKLTRFVAEVSDSRVEETVRQFAEREKDFRAADENHAAIAGDLVRMNYSGAIDGEPFEGGTAKDFRLVLGSGAFIPGFEDQLVGAKKGEMREVTATFPKDASNPALSGKTAVFAVEVVGVEEPQPVAVDDELAKRFGMADLGALRAAIRERAQDDYRGVARLKLKREVLDQLADGHDFDVPSGLVDREFEAIWRQIEQDMKRAGTTWADSDEDEETARKDYREIAERRVRLGLILTEIGRRNDISVPQNELNRAVMNRARLFPGREQQVFDMFRSDSSVMNELHAPLFEDRVIDFIIEMADVTEREVSEEELIREPGEGGGEGDAGPA